MADVNLMGMLHLHVTREGLIHHCHAGGAGNEIRVRDHRPLRNKQATSLQSAQNTRCRTKVCLQAEVTYTQLHPLDHSLAKNI
jgi:hypothetical protein